MKRILAQFDVFPQFLEHLHLFGLRHNTLGEDLPAIYMQRGSPRNDLFEMCFDVRYPEQNGRNNGDPWSIRHTALYYQYDNSTDMSVSLLIQPSEKLRRQINSLLACKALSGFQSFLIQQAVLVSSGLSWKPYVTHIEKELKILVSRYLPI